MLLSGPARAGLLALLLVALQCAESKSVDGVDEVKQKGAKRGALLRLLQERRDVGSPQSKRDLECEGLEWNGETSGTLEYPISKKKYPNDALCEWTISASADQVVRLEFSAFDVEYADGCFYDSLTVYDGDSWDELLFECGDELPSPVTSSSNTLVVVFSSDYGVRRTGFAANFQVYNQGEVPRDPCDASRPAVLTGSSGSLTLPVAGNGKYKNNANCEWKIEVPKDQTVQLSFTAFDVEDGFEGCEYDRVTVTEEDGTVLPGFPECGEDLPGPVTANGNVVFVKFSSDDSVRSTGFSANYQAVGGGDEGGEVPETPACGADRPELLSGSTGSLSVPVNDAGKYGADATCEWKITVDAGKRAHLHFDSFDLDDGGTACTGDRVQIYDGGNADAALLGRHCSDDVPGDITASGNELYVKFTSNGSDQRAGFSASFRNGGDIDEGGDSEEGGDSGEGGTVNGDPECGIPRVFGKTRIVGGTEATPHSWPWQVSLRDPNSWHFCGGSIINKRWILTAAHCRPDGDASGLTVMVGDHDRYSDSNDGETRISVSRVIVHENYDDNTVDNDIALLQLAEDVPWSDHVLPICLPSNDPAVDQECTITGWGDVENTDGADEKLLQQAKVPVLSHDECNTAYSRYGGVTANMLCAGYLDEGGKDSCQGDSGGPFVCRPSGVYVQQGVTSWGIGCADPGYPGVYARVTRFIDWIQQHVGTDGIQIV